MRTLPRVRRVHGEVRCCAELPKPVRDEKFDSEIGQRVKEPVIPLTVPWIHKVCSVGGHLEGRAYANCASRRALWHAQRVVKRPTVSNVRSTSIQTEGHTKLNAASARTEVRGKDPPFVSVWDLIRLLVFELDYPRAAL